MDHGPGERIEQEDCRRLIKNNEPSVGGPTAASVVRGFGEVEEVNLVGREAEEATAVGLVGPTLGEHQPWELTREVVRGIWG